MGLFLGASVITVFELLDVLIYNAIRKVLSTGKKKPSGKPGDSKVAIQNPSRLFTEERGMGIKSDWAGDKEENGYEYANSLKD